MHWKDWSWSWSSNPLATWFEELTHWKRPWCWERLKAGGEGGNRGWDGWTASLTQWTWVWANSRRQWRTGKPGVLQFIGLQRVRHNWATEQQQSETIWVQMFSTDITGSTLVSSDQSLSRVRLFVTPWTATTHQPFLSITNSRSFLKLRSIELVMPSSHLILFLLFSSCLQFLPASRPFQMSQLFTSGGQSIGVSASVLPTNIQEWFPLGLTGWISLQSKGLSRVFSNTTVQKHQFFGAQLSLYI